MKRLLLPTLLLLLVFISSCNTNKQMAKTSPFDPGPETERKEFVGSTWTIDRINGKEIIAPDGRNKPYLTFTLDGKVQGHSGCNPVNGTYTLEKGLRIKFDQMATGLALCSEITYERDFLDILNKTDNYTLVDGVLSLNKGRMAPMAVFLAKDGDLVTNLKGNFDLDAARQELVGANWAIDHLYGKKPVIADGRTVPYLTFTMDGKVHGNAGCNTLNGTYTLEKGLRIKFEQVAVTRMLCQDVNYENAFLEVLNDTDNYTVSNGILSLNKARMAPMAVLKKDK